MKDLYTRLGLDPEASEAQIEAAAKDSGHSESAAGVLLVADHRAGYDHCRATLLAIGNLRKRLKLDEEPSWFTRECADFVPNRKGAEVSAVRPQESSDGNPASGPGTTFDAEPTIEPIVEPKSGGGLNWPVIAVIVIGVALAAWAVLR
jgi:hypothetical protein